MYVADKYEFFHIHNSKLYLPPRYTISVCFIKNRRDCFVFFLSCSRGDDFPTVFCNILYGRVTRVYCKTKQIKTHSEYFPVFIARIILHTKCTRNNNTRLSPTHEYFSHKAIEVSCYRVLWLDLTMQSIFHSQMCTGVVFLSQTHFVLPYSH